MASLTLRLVKGEPLTNLEVDTNFSNLNADIQTRIPASSIATNQQVSDGASTNTVISPAGLASVLGTAGRATLTTAVNDTTLGHALKVGDFGVGSPIAIPSNADLNAYTTPGNFSAGSNAIAASVANTPTVNAFTLQVARATTSAVTQVVCQYNSNSMWFRTWNGTTGTAWVQFMHSGNTGSAAAANLTSSSTDTTSGRVTTVGYAGWGVSVHLAPGVDVNTIDTPGNYSLTANVNGATATGDSALLVYGVGSSVDSTSPELIQIHTWSEAGQTRSMMRSAEAKVSGIYSWGPWLESIHTGNIKRSTGADDNYPMSQRAVTEAVSQKVSSVNGKTDVVVLVASDLDAVPEWTRIAASADITATDRQSVEADTAAGTFTVTLPSPAVGMRINILDAAGTFADNPLTVSGAGTPIMGLSEDVSLDLANASVDLLYINSIRGWVFA